LAERGKESPVSAQTDNNEAYRALVELSRRYGARSRSLPAQIDVTPTRTVVCFHLLGSPVAILLDEMNELFEVPHCTRLPRVKPWVRGVANVRGKLTPIIDFASFLGGRLQTAPKRQRVLLIERDGIAAGLIVDDVVGMKHFRVDAYSERRDVVPPRLARFVPGTFLNDGEYWALFRPEALFGHGDFLDVAA
jgi:twitching motility protein PilI